MLYRAPYARSVAKKRSWVNRPIRAQRIELATLMTAGVAVAAASQAALEPWQTVLLIFGLGVALAAFLGLLPTFVIVRIIVVDTRDLLRTSGRRAFHRWDIGLGFINDAPVFYLESPGKNLVRDSARDPHQSASVECTIDGPGVHAVCAAPEYIREGSWAARDFAPSLPKPLPPGKYRATWNYDGLVRGKRFPIDRLGKKRVPPIRRWRRRWTAYVEERLR